MEDLLKQLFTSISSIAAQSTITAVIVGNATILVMVGARSWQLADRMRSNVEERLYKLPVAVRLSEANRAVRLSHLREQNRRFHKRYRTACRAFFALFTSLISFVLASLLSDSAEPKFWSGIFILIGSILVLYSALKMIIEFGKGSKTLSLNNKAIKFTLEDLNEEKDEEKAD